MIDAIVLILGLIIFVIFKVINYKQDQKPKTMIGQQIYTRNNQGWCQDITEGGYVRCINSDNLLFYVKANRLFWSNKELAFVEK